MKRMLLVTLISGMILGCSGFKAKMGHKNAPVKTPVVTEYEDIQVDIIASRDYDPSKFSPTEGILEMGSYEIPSVVELLVGVAGTGWASLTIGNVKLCYQGNGANNSQVGTAFNLKGQLSDPSLKCHNAPKGVSELLIALSEDTSIKLEINGGGVSAAIRTYTEGKAALLGTVIKK